MRGCGESTTGSAAGRIESNAMSASLFPQEAEGKSTQEMVVAHCDGGSRGNPGPAGYGAVIEDMQGRVIGRLSEFLGKRTNNFAEYSGLLGVLDWCLKNGYRRLRVVADSELMVKQMQGKYRVNSPDLRPLWEEARKRAAQLERFEIHHTLRGGNKEADQLANDAMDRGMGRAPAGAAGAAAGGAGAGGARGGSAAPVATRPAAVKPARVVLEGFVKNGVVHILEGELPDGIFVKIVRE